MYTLVRAVGKSHLLDRRWYEVDITNKRMIDLYTEYNKLYLVLTNPFITGEVTLDIDDIRDKYGVSELSFNEVLASLGNKALPTIDKIPTVVDKAARYVDAIMAGYKIKPVNAKKAHDAELPLGDKESLFLTKKNLKDLSSFKDYCMVAVNGYFHYVDSSKEGAWVIDGMKSQFTSLQNQIGIVSFKELGTIKYIPITEDKLFKLSPQQDYRYQMCVNLGEDINSKTVLLVLGGYAYILDPRYFYQLNDTCILINTGKLDLIEKYHESRNYLDYSELPFERSNINESMVNQNDFLSDENLVAYATMSQSFVVLIDNNELYTEKFYVRTPPTPKLGISFTKPTLPMFHKVGSFVNYWPIEEHGQWGLHIEDNQWSRRQYETITHKKLEALADHEQTQRPVELSPLYFLKIGSDITLK